MTESESSKSYDAIVIGSGFAGAVSACRLAEAGLSVCILERGRRFIPDQDFPVYPTPGDSNVPSDAPEDGRDLVQPDVSRMFWKLGNGVWDFRDLGDLLVAQAAGYGGGSLIYANVHLRPAAHVFDERWPINRTDLEPYYDLAAKMLEVGFIPKTYDGLPKQVQLGRAASELNGRQQAHERDCPQNDDTYLRTFAPPLAVDFHEGNGRKACDLQGNCCFGCRQGAKNTLDLNYLNRAEKAGADVRTLAEVVWIERVDDKVQGRFKVDYRDHLAASNPKAVYGAFVFLCAGAVNTTELLMRCRRANKLRFPGVGLGTHFHPNQDNLAVIFDCDEPHELDRGPTITGSLLYDREPDDDDPSARWRLAFDRASFEPTFGSKIRSDSGGKAKIVSPAYIVTGSFEDGDAIGEITLARLDGDSNKDDFEGDDFKEGDELFIGAKRWGRVATRVHKHRHWFLIQDGGLPVDVEPALGVYRSPVWLGRNAFREPKRARHEALEPASRDESVAVPHDHAEHAAASQRIGYASLPIEALTSLFAGLTRGALRVPELSEIGFQLLHQSNDSDAERKDKGRWQLLPSQLNDALSHLLNRALDSVGLATEGIVSSFLEDAADSVSERLNSGLIAVAGDVDKAQIEQIELASRALRLGVQLMWGSQGGLARAIARQLFETSFSGQGRPVEAAVDLLTRALDYRLGNGRTAMVLSMGLDSVPGRLELDLPNEPAVGTEVRGAKSGSRAYLVHTQVHKETSFGDGTAVGTFIVTGASGAFEPGEILLAGRAHVAKVRREEPHVQADLPLRALHFEPLRFADARHPALTAPLRAHLPESIDTPERGVQERVLRDIASAWDGELRTDPLWSLFDRRLTVHAQGGCPMGPATRAVTKETGEVHGCDGLFVMDAAAFPGPVGANPSATIAAIAEYKVAKLIESLGVDATRIAKLKKERHGATEWVDKLGRKRLDPLGQGGRVAPGPRSAKPAHRPVGIEFRETMVGTVTSAGVSLTVETRLVVRIGDLSEFLALHARDSTVRVPIVGGEIRIRDQRGSSCSTAKIDSDESYMIVLARAGVDRRGNEVRTITYHLAASDEEKGDKTRGCKWTLDGHKTIKDDPGFDAWEDTTRLEITELNLCGLKSQGELVLPAAEFFSKQLPSFKADTDDPVRQAWAMAAFGRFFFGNLAAVYLPGLDRLGELTTKLLRRGHG